MPKRLVNNYRHLGREKLRRGLVAPRCKQSGRAARSFVETTRDSKGSAGLTSILGIDEAVHTSRTADLKTLPSHTQTISTWQSHTGTRDL